MRIHPLGDAALLIELGSRIDVRLNGKARDLARRLRQLTGVEDAVASYCAVTVYYEPARVSFNRIREFAAARTPHLSAPDDEGKTFEIPVVYDGPDLADTAGKLGLDASEVVELHSAPTYYVFLIGFLPGQPYLGPLPPRLRLPRSAVPRAQVPAGSVAIAGRQTIVYPWGSPSGWHVLGRTSTLLFHSDRRPPALLRAGDRVRFIPA